MLKTVPGKRRRLVLVSIHEASKSASSDFKTKATHINENEKSVSSDIFVQVLLKCYRFEMV